MLVCSVSPVLVYSVLVPYKRQVIRDFTINSDPCRQVILTGFGAPKCGDGENKTLPFTTLIDTDGVVQPLNWTNRGEVKIKSLKLSSIYNAAGVTNCKPIQFMFYNEQGLYSGATDDTPGEAGHKCLDYYGSTIAMYNGVTLLVSI